MAHPSRRVVEQLLWNRAMEALETFAAGDAGVRSEGCVKYFEECFDSIGRLARPVTGRIATGCRAHPRRQMRMFERGPLVDTLASHET